MTHQPLQSHQPGQTHAQNRASHLLSRRTMLRGLGVSMALPWLESLAVWGDDSKPGMK